MAAPTHQWRDMALPLQKFLSCEEKWLRNQDRFQFIIISESFNHRFRVGPFFCVQPVEVAECPFYTIAKPEQVEDEPIHREFFGLHFFPPLLLPAPRCGNQSATQNCPAPSAAAVADAP